MTSVSPKSAKKGSVALDSDGKTVTYRPYRNFSGEDSFSYTVGDGNGGEATGTVRVTVKEVNDKPIVKDDSAATEEDVPVTVNVLGNDDDSDDGIVPASVHVIAAPANGTATVDRATGKISYAPKDNYSGPDSLRYEVCDQSKACVQANVAITVRPVNDRPTAGNNKASTAEDNAVTIDVLADDDDSDGAIDRTSLRIISGPSHGRAVPWHSISMESKKGVFVATISNGKELMDEIPSGNVYLEFSVTATDSARNEQSRRGPAIPGVRQADSDLDCQ